MFEGALQPMHWLVVAVIALIFFGPSDCPSSAGHSVKRCADSRRA